MALQEAAVYDCDVNFLLFGTEEEEAYFINTRQVADFLLRKDHRDPLWQFTNNQSVLCMYDEEWEYGASRDPATSFPTPKLGAKTRTC